MEEESAKNCCAFSQEEAVHFARGSTLLCFQNRCTKSKKLKKGKWRRRALLAARFHRKKLRIARDSTLRFQIWCT